MIHNVTRRQFLGRSGALAAGLYAAGCAVSVPASDDAFGLYKISLAQWSLNKLFKAKGAIWTTSISQKPLARGLDWTP